MEVSVIKIGNSKGIRLSKTLLIFLKMKILKHGNKSLKRRLLIDHKLLCITQRIV